MFLRNIKAVLLIKVFAPFQTSSISWHDMLPLTLVLIAMQLHPMDVVGALRCFRLVVMRITSFLSRLKKIIQSDSQCWRLGIPLRVVWNRPL